MFHRRVFGPLLASCALAAAGHAAEIRIVGSDLLGPAFVRAFEKFGRENDTTITASLAGTRPSLEQLRAGAADVGLVVLPPDNVWLGEQFVVRAIAYQPVVVVVPEKLPLTQLALPQLRGLFAVAGADDLNTWGELGLTGEWRTRAIARYAVESGSALTLPVFRRAVLNGAELKSLAGVSPLASVLERVRASDNGIGLLPLVPDGGSGLRALALAPSVRESAHLPTRENLHDGRYPLRLSLGVAFRRETASQLLVFLRFLLSDECAEALAQAHFQALPTDARNQLLFELEALSQP